MELWWNCESDCRSPIWRFVIQNGPSVSIDSLIPWSSHWFPFPALGLHFGSGGGQFPLRHNPCYCIRRNYLPFVFLWIVLCNWELAPLVSSVKCAVNYILFHHTLNNLRLFSVVSLPERNLFCGFLGCTEVVMGENLTRFKRSSVCKPCCSSTLTSMSKYQEYLCMLFLATLFWGTNPGER